MLSNRISQACKQKNVMIKMAPFLWFYTLQDIQSFISKRFGIMRMSAMIGRQSWSDTEYYYLGEGEVDSHSTLYILSCTIWVIVYSDFLCVSCTGLIFWRLLCSISEIENDDQRTKRGSRGINSTCWHAGRKKNKRKHCIRCTAVYLLFTEWEQNKTHLLSL